MAFFKRKERAPVGVSTQLRGQNAPSFGLLQGSIPLGGGTARLYRAIRQPARFKRVAKLPLFLCSAVGARVKGK